MMRCRFLALLILLPMLAGAQSRPLIGKLVFDPLPNSLPNGEGKFRWSDNGETLEWATLDGGKGQPEDVSAEQVEATFRYALANAASKRRVLIDNRNVRGWLIVGQGGFLHEFVFLGGPKGSKELYKVLVRLQGREVAKAAQQVEYMLLTMRLKSQPQLAVALPQAPAPAVAQAAATPTNAGISESPFETLPDSPAGETRYYLPNCPVRLGHNQADVSTVSDNRLLFRTVPMVGDNGAALYFAQQSTEADFRTRSVQTIAAQFTQANQARQSYDPLSPSAFRVNGLLIFVIRGIVRNHAASGGADMHQYYILVQPEGSTTVYSLIAQVKGPMYVATRLAVIERAIRSLRIDP